MSAIEKPDVIGATRRAETIRSGMIGYAAAMEAIGEAFEARDWVALGHKNWDEYCEKEFSEKRLKLTQQQREQAVLAFRGAGMSIRAIGSALGVSTTTIQRDLYQSDTPAAVVGGDGKTYAASKPATEDTPVVQPPTPDAPEAAYSEPRTGSVDGQPEVDRQDANPGETDEGADLSVADGAATPSAEREPGPTGVSAPAPAIDHSGGRGEEQGQAAASVPAPGKVARNEEDPEQIKRAMRERATVRFCEGIVNLALGLPEDLREWLDEVYLPGSYKVRDMPKAREALTAAGIKVTAQRLYELADHLQETGQELL